MLANEISGQLVSFRWPLNIKLGSIIAFMTAFSIVCVGLVLNVAVSKNFEIYIFLVGVFSFCLSRRTVLKIFPVSVSLHWVWIPVFVIIGMTRMNTFGNYRSGQDQVTYVLMAHEILRNNSFEFEDRFAKDPSLSIRSLSRSNLRLSVFESRPGFLQINFYPLFPTLLAQSIKRFGAEAFVFVSPVVSIFGLFVFGIFLTWIFQSQWIGLALVIVTGLNPALSFVSQWTLTEPLTFLLLWSGIFTSWVIIQFSFRWFYQIAFLCPIFTALLLTRMHFAQLTLALVFLLLFDLFRNKNMKVSILISVFLPCLMAIGFSIFFYWNWQNLFFEEMRMGTFLSTFKSSLRVQIFLILALISTVIFFVKKLYQHHLLRELLKQNSNFVLLATFGYVCAQSFFGDFRFMDGKYGNVDLANIFTSVTAKILVYVGPLVLLLLLPISKPETHESNSSYRTWFAAVIYVLSAFIFLQSLFSSILPDGYYFSRYLYAEIIPLTLTAITIRLVILKFKSWAWVGACLILQFMYTLPFALPIWNGPEGDPVDIYKSIAIEANSKIVLVENPSFLSQTLNHVFNVNSILIDRNIEVEALVSLKNEFAASGREEPLVLSNSCKWRTGVNEFKSVYRDFSFDLNDQASSSMLGSVFKRLPPFRSYDNSYTAYLCNLSRYLEQYQIKDSLDGNNIIENFWDQKAIVFKGQHFLPEPPDKLVWFSGLKFAIDVKIQKKCSDGRISFWLRTLKRDTVDSINPTQVKFKNSVSKFDVREYFAEFSIYGAFQPGVNTFEFESSHSEQPKVGGAIIDNRRLSLAIRRIAYFCNDTK